MPNARITQTSFTAGVLDQRMIARADLEGVYDKGMLKGENVLSIPYGGLSKRIGTKYIATLPEGTKRLLRFEFSTTQTYLFVLVNARIYIYRDGELVTNINGTGNDYLAVADFTAARIPTVDYTQSADTMILVHPDVHPKRLMRGNDHNIWTYQDLPFDIQPTFDFGEDNYTGITFTVPDGADVGSKTVTASSSIFRSAHIGGSFRTFDGYARITAVSSGTQATINIIRDLDTIINEGDQNSAGMEDDGTSFSGQVVALEEPAFNATHGYPRSVIFHENRLWFGGTRSLPQTVWASNSGYFFNFEIGEGLADEGIQLSLDTDEVNAINHMASGRYLQLFTSGATFYIRTAEAGPVTPADNAATRVESFGSKPTVKPVTVETQTLYVDRPEVHVRSFFYDFSQDNFANDTTSLRAPDLIDEPVDIEAFTRFGREEGNYVLVVNDDGTIACLNLLSTENIKAWTQIILHTDEVLGQLNVTNVREVEEVVYLVISNLQTGVDTLVAFEDGTYTDANTVYTNRSGTISGLERFNGRRVSIIVDGVVEPRQLVINGQVTLPEGTHQRIEIGLPYEVDVELMPVVAGDGQGLGLLEQKRITQVEVFLSEETLGLTINGFRQPDRNFGTQLLDQAPVGRTQVRRTPVLGYNRVNTTTLGQTDPLPWQVLAVVQQVYI